jgi:hypothetical protein
MKTLPNKCTRNVFCSENSSSQSHRMLAVLLLIVSSGSAIQNDLCISHSAVAEHTWPSYTRCQSMLENIFLSAIW